jgi:hypothetical protein
MSAADPIQNPPSGDPPLTYCPDCCPGRHCWGGPDCTHSEPCPVHGIPLDGPEGAEPTW